MIKNLTICTPFYNEESGLKKYFLVLEKIIKSLDSNIELKILLIDDGSNDDTLKKLYMYQSKYKNYNIKIHAHEKNYGYGKTLKNSIIISDTSHLITYDSDCVYDHGLIKKFIELVNNQNYDLVNVSYKLSKEKNLKVNFLRQFLSSGCSTFYRIIFKEIRNYNLNVFTCSYRIYNLEKIKKIDLVSDDFSCIAELMIKCMKKNLKITEIPGTNLPREHGFSKMKIFQSIISHLKNIFLIYFSKN